jgi:glycosyltransferase involved in cell wall biosynthesis
MAHPVDLASAARLAGLIRGWQPDTVHLHTATAHSVGCLASALLRLESLFHMDTRSQPSFIASKRTDFSPRRGWLAQLRYSRLVDRVTAVSGSARQALVQSGIPSHMIEVIYSSVDCDHFCPGCAPDLRRQLGIPIEALVVGVVGHLTPRKGQHFLLRAAPAILERVPRACFLFCGEGQFRQRLEQMAAALGVSEQVRFLGFMPDVRPALQSLDVFVLPSEREALGVALLEAMAMGKPVVGSRVGGIAEAVEHGKSGLLVPPGDVEALAGAVLALLLDGNLRERIGQAARQRALSMFSMPVMVQKTERLYLELISDRTAPAVRPRPKASRACRPLQ